MRLAYINACGFRGIKDEIHVPITSGFVVITGRNGAGKSTLCDAVEYALTGTLEKYSQETEKGESISDYIRWRGAGKCDDSYVSIGLVDQNGNITNIRRNIHDGKLLVEGDIESCLCHTYSPRESLKQLCKTSIIRDETITRFSLDMSEYSRYEFVKEAIGVTDFNVAENKIKKAISSIQEEITKTSTTYEVTRGKISSIKMAISEAQSQILMLPDITHAVKEIQTITDCSSTDLQTILNHAKSASSGFRILLSKLDRLKIISVSLENEMEGIKTAEFKSRVLDITSNISKLTLRRDELVSERQSLTSILEEREKDLPVISSWMQIITQGKRVGLQDCHCPLCDSIIDQRQYNDNVNRREKILENQASELSDIQRKHQDVSDQLVSISKELGNLEHEYSILNFKASQIENELQSLHKDIKCDGYLIDVTSINAAVISKLIMELQGSVSRLESSISTLEASQIKDTIANQESLLESLQKHSDACETDIKGYKGKLNSLKDAHDVIKRVSGEIVDEQLSTLSPLLRELYLRLKPHVDWLDLDYAIRGDVKKFLSLRVGDSLNPRYMFSSGQRRAAGLAFLLSVLLSRSWCKLKTVILDDPVQHIDDFRSLHLVEVLSGIRQSGYQIICTVEDSQLADLLCRRLRVIHDLDGSEITMDSNPGTGVYVNEIKHIGSIGQNILMVG